jgi:hypothetical protein
MRKRRTPPSDGDILDEFKANTEELAEKEQQGEPGSTRISLFVSRDKRGDIQAEITTANRHSDPLPALSPSEIHLYRYVNPRQWNTSNNDGQLTSEMVENLGLEFFARKRTGPAGPW